MDIFCEIQNNKTNSERMAEDVKKTVDQAGRVIFEVDLKRTGEYGMNVYAKEKGEGKQIHHVHTYLVNNTAGDASDVGEYDLVESPQETQRSRTKQADRKRAGGTNLAEVSGEIGHAKQGTGAKEYDLVESPPDTHRSDTQKGSRNRAGETNPQELPGDIGRTKQGSRAEEQILVQSSPETHRSRTRQGARTRATGSNLGVHPEESGHTKQGTRVPRSSRGVSPGETGHTKQGTKARDTMSASSSGGKASSLAARYQELNMPEPKSKTPKENFIQMDEFAKMIADDLDNVGNKMNIMTMSTHKSEIDINLPHHEFPILAELTRKNAQDPIIEDQITWRIDSDKQVKFYVNISILWLPSK